MTEQMKMVRYVGLLGLCVSDTDALILSEAVAMIVSEAVARPLR